MSSIFKAINQIPISDIIIDNGLDEPKLNKHVGRSGAKIKCIFHNDDTPSWNIYPGDRQSYCFGCGKAHTSYDVLKYLDWDISEMVELAESYGIDVGEQKEEVSDTVNLDISQWVSDNRLINRKDRNTCRQAEKTLKRMQNKGKTK